MSKDNNFKNENEVKSICNPVDSEESLKDKKLDSKDQHKGTYKSNMGPQTGDTATDVYYKTECKLPDSKVAVPTYDSVVEAKEWVDEENKM